LAVKGGMPFGPHIFALLESGLTECFKYHNGLDAFVLRAGLPQPRLPHGLRGVLNRRYRERLAEHQFFNDPMAGDAAMQRAVAPSDILPAFDYG
jgi:hypothetical protein